MNYEDVEQRIRSIQRDYVDFLDDESDQGVYEQQVKDMVAHKEQRLIVNINDVRRKIPARASHLLNEGLEELIAFQRALREVVANVDATYAKSHEEFFVGFEGSFGGKHVTPRTLTSRYLGNMVCTEGIVTKCSMVHPKLVRSVHYCPATGKSLERKYTDLTSYDPYPSSAVYPTKYESFTFIISGNARQSFHFTKTEIFKDDDNNPLVTEFGLCTFKDHQTITIQEMPEKSPAGQLPRSVDVICDNDLVDKCKPGDRIQVVGIYRCLPGKQGSFTTGTFRTLLIANNIIQLNKEASISLHVEDVKNCKKFSRQKGDVFSILAKSLAPSIHGHDYVKKALLCLLLGGTEKTLPNGTRLRGDINVLLIGDPSVAKSQMLRYVLNTAPRAITTTGRGSSGVGLTAAVTTDNETGERRLEAGAMVLADRGVVCIDEFDKMSDMDRTAIHEVMEQGRVTITKAGIQAHLNARCSVLAAANPVYGRYDSYKTPMENIGLQDSLLSRFDLLFILLDTVDQAADRMISDHVVRMHRFRAHNEPEGAVLPMSTAVDLLSTGNLETPESVEEETPIYEKYDPLLHGATRSKHDKIVSLQFMRKYIHIARALQPSLTQEAADLLAEEYSRLRCFETENTNMARTQPVTARALETLIRLSTAHARARMSRKVEAEDASAAIELLQYACFKTVLEKPRKRRRGDDESGSEAESEADGETQSTQKSKKQRKERTEPGDVYDYESDDEVIIPMTPRSSRGSRSERSTADGQADSQPSQSQEGEISKERFELFRNTIRELMISRNAQTVEMSVVRSALEVVAGSQLFTDEEVKAAIDFMTEENQIMVADEMIFLI